MQQDLIALVRQRVGQDELWTQIDEGGHWFCPYCGATVEDAELSSADPRGSLDRSGDAIARHLAQTCRPFLTGRPAALKRKAPGATATVSRPREENLSLDTAVLGTGALVRFLRKALREDDIWRQMGPRNRWFCPFCGEVQEFMVPTDTLLMMQDVPHLIAGHLQKGCKRYRPGESPRQRISAAQMAPAPSAAAAGAPASASTAGAPAVPAAVAPAPAMPDPALLAMYDEAKRRQRLMLAKPPIVPGFEFGSFFKPAESIGGDFYDFVNVGEDQIGITIGDVTGHGVEAAIVMSMVRKLINYIGRTNSSPSEVLAVVNDEIYSELDCFVSVFYCVIDIRDRTLTYCRAGHNPPLLTNPSRKPPCTTLVGGGMALGVDVGMVFQGALENVVLPLQSGDMILVFTDGVTEAMNPAGEEYGDERLEEIVQRLATRRIEESLMLISTSVEKFAAGRPLEDDVTMVGVKVL